MRRISVSLMALAAVALLTSLAIADGGASCDMKHANAKAAEMQTDVKAVSTYPIDYCIVSGEKLETMGEPAMRTYGGREVRFCGEQCVKTFEKDKAAYLKKLDAAVASSQKADYPLQTCVVTGEKLGGMGDPVDYVYDNHLVRFCCGGCIGTFKKDPAKYTQVIEQAREEQTAKAKTQ